MFYDGSSPLDPKQLKKQDRLRTRGTEQTVETLAPNVGLTSLPMANSLDGIARKRKISSSRERVSCTQPAEFPPTRGPIPGASATSNTQRTNLASQRQQFYEHQ